MKYVFKLIYIPEDILVSVRECKVFKMNLPKGSIVHRVVRGREDYAYIQYPKDNSNTEEEVSFFLFSVEEKIMDIPEEMELYPIDVRGMGPAILFGLKKK